MAVTPPPPATLLPWRLAFWFLETELEIVGTARGYLVTFG